MLCPAARTVWYRRAGAPSGAFVGAQQVITGRSHVTPSDSNVSRVDQRGPGHIRRPSDVGSGELVAHVSSEFAFQGVLAGRQNADSPSGRLTRQSFGPARGAHRDGSAVRADTLVSDLVLTNMPTFSR